nr:carboxypeptidase regulatory-like domain-containing protein [Paracidobacterium acidisoli]
MHVYAQSDTSSIAGFVKDQSGAVIPHAQVTVTSEATQESHTVTTDNKGYYSLSSLPAGFYTVAVRMQGFKLFESVHDKLDAVSTLSINATLTIGVSNESVKVISSADLIQTDSGAVQHQITEEQIQHQELNGRNPVYMAELLPGVITGATLGDFNFSVSKPGFSINGARSTDTTVTIDGAPAVRTRANTYVIGVPNVDSTEEMQVLTAAYAAEYGGAGGGQVRMVSKSGTTDFHGTAYEYLRNSALNANTWSRNESPSTRFASPFRYNDFGFAAGGPVWIPGLPPVLRRKLFWFVAQDWIRYRYTDTVFQTVPTALMRAGNFSELLGPNPFYSSPVILRNPFDCTTTNGKKTCAPLPGNTIPQNLLSSNGTALLNAYPAPIPGLLVNGNQNWEAVAPHPINQRKGSYNFDFVLNDRHRISFRRTDLSYNEYSALDQGSGLTGKYKTWPNQTNTLAWSWTITPTIVNEMNGTLSIDRVANPVNDALPGFHRTQLGINYNYIVPGGKDVDKIPSLSLSKPFYSLSGGPYPSHSGGPIYTFSDSLSKAAGNHMLKFGFQFDYRGENDDDQINITTVPGGSNNQNGTFTLTDSYANGSGLGIANLALGLADSYTEIGPRAYTIWRGAMYEWFAQDSWQITSRLHLDYGLRDTLVFPFHALWGNSVYFDPELYDPAQAISVNPATGLVALGTGNQYNGMVIPGLSGFPSGAAKHGVYQANFPSTYAALFDKSLPRGLMDAQNAFQPRLGIAYQFKDKTVIRAGGGRFLTRMGLLDNIFPGGNSPFQPFVTVTNISVDNPGAGLTSVTTPTLTVTTLDRHMKQPEAWNWNVTVEKQLPGHSVLSVAYVGRRGLHLWYSEDANQVPAGTTYANPHVNIAALVPYKGFSQILTELSRASSKYNSLQVFWSRRFTNGLDFSAAYTLAKSMDNSSSYSDIVPDTYNTSNLWGPSTFDVRHAFVATSTYDLPFLREQQHLAGKIFGGWQLSGTAQYLSGAPGSVYSTNTDYAGTGEPGLPQFWVMHGRATYPRQFSRGASSSTTYFNTTTSNGDPLFTAPPQGTFNLQHGIRDSIYGPGFQDWNAGLFKKFAIDERNVFEFRAEAYDVFNHPNWSSPNFTPGTSTFGKVTGKTDLSRQLQLSLRYSF